MVNEGMVINTSDTLMKSEMLRQLHRLGATTPQEWQAAVFRALTGEPMNEVDWEVEDNQAGAFLWVKSFDHLVSELVEDGYVIEETRADGTRLLSAAEADPPMEPSLLVDPEDHSG